MSGNHNKVFFDFLTPVNFLSRSASIYPDKTAVVYEGQALYIPGVLRQGKPPGKRP